MIPVEYRFEALSLDDQSKRLVAVLDRFGEDGWKIAWFHPETGSIILYREKKALREMKNG